MAGTAVARHELAYAAPGPATLTLAAGAEGARVLTGGEIPSGPGAHYPATVVVDVPADADLMREETFGPVAAVRVVGSFDEALAAVLATVQSTVGA